MIHLNFGGEKPHISYALDVESGKLRLYSQMQTGFGLASVACGPVQEFDTWQGSTHLGIQGSV